MTDTAPRSGRAGRTAKVLVQRIDADTDAADAAPRRVPDHLIVEEPLAIELDGVRVATTMRTPGHDFELAVGFCFGDGLLGGAPVLRCRYCGAGSPVDTAFNVVTVETGGRAPRPEPRLTTTSSSCGLCGSASIDELTARLAPLDGVAPFPVELLATLPDRAREHQPLFAETGAVHAAAAFDRDGELVLLREDIGRHNAVDKVVGRGGPGGPARPPPDVRRRPTWRSTSAAAPRSRWCRRRGQRGSRRWSPSARPPRSPCAPQRPHGSSSQASPDRAA